MTPEHLLTIVGIMVTIQIAIVGFLASQLWAHVAECRQLIARLEGIARDVERMKEDIGTHETGMRGEIHRTASLCTQHALQIAMLERDSQ